MDIFIGLCGQVRNGYESSGRGESRLALNLLRCLKDYDHHIVVAPDMEEARWGNCVRPENVELFQPWDKHKINSRSFDVAIFSSWLSERNEAFYIHARKYLWAIMGGWKREVEYDGYNKDNDYIVRWTREDLESCPTHIDFRDRCALLAQPFGKSFGESKFKNKRVAWVAKEAFMPQVNPSLSESAARHLFAVIDACKETGSSLSIFCCHELDPKNAPRIVELGVYDKLKELDKVIMYPTLSVPEYARELQKCSVTMPMAFAGSVQESVFNGLVPLMYKDNTFAYHPAVRSIVAEMTNGKSSRFQDEAGKKDILSSEEIKNKTIELLTDESKYNYYLKKLRPMVEDNLDDAVVGQLMDIMNHRNKTDNIRR